MPYVGRKKIPFAAGYKAASVAAGKFNANQQAAVSRFNGLLALDVGPVLDARNRCDHGIDRDGARSVSGLCTAGDGAPVPE